MRLAVVILHYGNPALTGSVFDALCAADPRLATHIRVFDNAAPEAFAGAWVRSARNVYWAGALEQTLEMVRAEGYTHLWFLNNDIRFVSPAPLVARVIARLGQVEKRMERPVGIYSPAVQRSPYYPQMCVRPALSESVQPQTGQADSASSLLPGMRRVSIVDGIAPVYSLQCLEAVGGLDMGENVYGYGVDMWLAFRVHQAGWPVLVDEAVVMDHRYHTTARNEPGFMQQAALAENMYLTARMGPNWRERLQAMQSEPAVQGRAG